MKINTDELEMTHFKNVSKTKINGFTRQLKTLSSAIRAVAVWRGSRGVIF